MEEGSARTKRGAGSEHAGEEEARPNRPYASENAEGMEGNASEDFPVRGHVLHKEDDEENSNVMMQVTQFYSCYYRGWVF